MTTHVRIKLLTQNYEIKQRVLDSVNAKYILSYDIKGLVLYMTLDEDKVRRNDIIRCIPEELLEYVDIIEISDYAKKEDEPVSDNPFVTADKYRSK